MPGARGRWGYGLEVSECVQARSMSEGSRRPRDCEQTAASSTEPSACDNGYPALTFACPASMRRLIFHCCRIPSNVLVTQYSTRPAGKNTNVADTTSGMN